eukprot:238654_1
MNDIQINLTISSFRFNQKISTLIRKYHTTIIKKSLENDETKVWKYKRPSPKENGINIHHGPYFYKEIGIDIHHGPYLDSNTYKLDVMYHGLSDIFPQDLQSILNEGTTFEIYEYIAYNHYKYDRKFRKYWRETCGLLTSTYRMNDVIFVDNKYILVSWLAPSYSLYAWEGYEDDVATCGG